MKVTILQENLARALSAISRVIPARAQIPALQNTLIQTKNNRVMLVGTSTDTTIVYWCDGKVEKDGGVCVPARTLGEFVATLPPGPVTIEDEKEGNVEVSCGRFRATVAGVATSEFPPTPTPGKTTASPLGSTKFSEVLSRALFAATTDEARPILSGVRISESDKEMVVVATDGYRLSRINVPQSSPGGLDVIVPAKALFEVLRLVKEAGEEGKLTLSIAPDGQLLFTVGEAEVYTRRIDGEFPPVEKIIPKNWATRTIVDRESFLRAVKSAAIFARDNSNIIKISIDRDTVAVSANAPSVGENRVEIEARTEGDGGEIAFNSRFLLEYLSSTTGDQISFEMTGSLNPGAFRPVGDDSYLHIIMPVRVSS